MIDLTGRYCSQAHSSLGLAWSWNLDPVLLAALALMLPFAWRTGAARRPAALAAWGTLVAAFLSPLCALSADLFSARAAHHILLVGVAAPLAAAAWPSAPRIGAVPATAIATATLWFWHLPAAYDAALSDIGLYWAMQATLGLTAWTCWAAIRRAAPTQAVIGVVGGAVGMGFLGALLTFTPRALYASHLSTTAAWGIGPLGDQQLAGMVMWVPGMVPYAVAGFLLASAGWRALGRAPSARTPA